MAVVAGWRWWIDRDRSPLLLAGALVGSVVATIVLYGGGLPLAAVKAAVGLFWIALGILELVAWLSAPRPSLQSPWISLASLLAGVVTLTFPSVLVVELTAVVAVWALLFGAACLLRGGWLAFLARRPARLIRPSQLRRAIAIGMPAVLLIGTGLGYGNLVARTAASQGQQAELAPFYEVPSDLAPGDPGSLIRAEIAHLAGLHGTPWRVLFRSQDAHNRATVSSGMVFVPAAGGTDRPVVAWAHGTVGIGPLCAPSRDADFLHHTTWINDALDRGWVVAATDYAGAAGTGLGEKYMVLAEQGRDVINSVRAARAVPGSGAGDRYLTYGESQGADTILSPSGQEHYAEVADHSCVLDTLSALINPQMGVFFGGDPTRDARWRAALIENKAPSPPDGVPVFVGHGLADPLIDPSFSVGLAQRYCTAGATVTTDWMPGVQHIGSSNSAAPDYLAWAANLMSGGHAPSSCGETPPVAPAPELE